MYELLFHPEAESEIYDLEPIMQAKVLKGLEKLEAKGPELRYPDTVSYTHLTLPTIYSV